MNILGMMSGTSLDGVDLALCHFGDSGYEILAARTIAYSRAWRERLASVAQGSAIELAATHTALGHLYGQMAHAFLAEVELPADAIASHGHTIFHQPQNGLTLQIGDGNAIAAETGKTVVCNFRALDVALGGQGAPLVPIGDAMLFGHYDACLNLGGIANISFDDDEGTRRAFDVCPCNMVLNALAAELGLDYDPEGSNARRGLLDYYLGETLNRMDYYRAAPPKSLGREWVVTEFWPKVAAAGISVTDKLRTMCEHIARQVAAAVPPQGIESMLVTGGGAHNTFLVETIASMLPEVKVTVPDDLTIDYKEALIFALLGYLRLEGKQNTPASVTGARCNSVGGDICGMACQE